MANYPSYEANYKLLSQGSDLTGKGQWDEIMDLRVLVVLGFNPPNLIVAISVLQALIAIMMG